MIQKIIKYSNIISAVTRIFGLGYQKTFFVTNEFNCIKIDNNAIFQLMIFYQ
jgi:hypothetical protein